VFCTNFGSDKDIKQINKKLDFERELSLKDVFASLNEDNFKNCDRVNIWASKLDFDIQKRPSFSDMALNTN